jgi:hypothetical protein
VLCLSVLPSALARPAHHPSARLDLLCGVLGLSAFAWGGCSLLGLRCPAGPHNRTHCGTFPALLALRQHSLAPYASFAYAASCFAARKGLDYNSNTTGVVLQDPSDVQVLLRAGSFTTSGITYQFLPGDHRDTIWDRSMGAMFWLAPILDALRGCSSRRNRANKAVTRGDYHRLSPGESILTRQKLGQLLGMPEALLLKWSTDPDTYMPGKRGEDGTSPEYAFVLHLGRRGWQSSRRGGRPCQGAAGTASGWAPAGSKQRCSASRC